LTKSQISRHETFRFSTAIKFGEWGLIGRCPIAQINFEFDFVILRTGPDSFQYQILNEQKMFVTRHVREHGLNK
jgi:hypothetical protein